MGKSQHNPEFDAYAETAEPFARPVFAHLKKLIRATCPNVTEDIKWGIPHFEYGGDVLCIFAAYNKHCSFTFYKDALMGDPRLKANADLPAAKRFMGKMTDVSDLPSDADLTAWIKEAMSLNERGIKLPTREKKTPKVVTIPAAFAERLEVSPKVKEIFDGKSAAYQKEYNLWIGDAKTDATRNKLIDEAMEWIAEGKGRFWKYAKI